MKYNLVLFIFIFLGFTTSAFAQKLKTKHIVEIKRMKFNPPELNIRKGDTVVWINRDFFPHDVASINDKSWKTKPLEQGESWSKVITKSEGYFCPLHIVMKGKLIVED
jgi:plastocyanin